MRADRSSSCIGAEAGPIQPSAHAASARPAPALSPSLVSLPTAPSAAALHDRHSLTGAPPEALAPLEEAGCGLALEGAALALGAGATERALCMLGVLLELNFFSPEGGCVLSASVSVSVCCLVWSE